MSSEQRSCPPAITRAPTGPRLLPPTSSLGGRRSIKVRAPPGRISESESDDRSRHSFTRPRTAARARRAEQRVHRTRAGRTQTRGGFPGRCRAGGLRDARRGAPRLPGLALHTRQRRQLDVDRRLGRVGIRAARGPPRLCARSRKPSIPPLRLGARQRNVFLGLRRLRNDDRDARRGDPRPRSRRRISSGRVSIPSHTSR
jgi:hypothetical protein